MTTHVSDCGCGPAPFGYAGGSGVALGGGFTERTRYYPRQIVQAVDLTQDQLYFRERLRRHNRMLHGWGIVCGVRVKLGTRPGTVLVEPGTVLGPFGDEIVVGDTVEVDLTAQNLDGDAASGFTEADPWCADVPVAHPSNRPVYLAIAFAEYDCRPVNVPAGGCSCGCEGPSCEYSRVRDSWRIRVLPDLPSSYPAKLAGPAVATAYSCTKPPVKLDAAGHPVPADPTACDCPACQPCPSSPWVVLADITLNGTEVTRLDCDAHRRYVASFRDFFYTCAPRATFLPGNLAGFLDAADIAGLLDTAHPSATLAGAKVTKLLLANPLSQGVLERVKDLSIGEVAGAPREEFIARITEGKAGVVATNMAKRAGELWDRASGALAVVDS